MGGVAGAQRSRRRRHPDQQLPGGTRDRTLRKMEKADWNFVLRTDLDSRFHTTRPLVEPMMARGWGRIVSISSVNAFAGGRADRNSRQNPAASSQTSES